MARYTTDELRRRRTEGQSQTDLRRLRAMSEEEVEAGSRADKAEHEIPDDWYRNARPIESKTPISIRLDDDLLAFFRAQGAGWQTRINNVLRAYKDAVEKPARP